jgi:AcrR family transcriptional regulator
MVDEKQAKVVAAARQVFLRYGFKRTTMGDIAEAAQMSRPALYLVYPSKEEVFAAVAAQALTAMLEEARQGVGRLAATSEQLAFVFEVWSVRPFELMLASPDAKDLLEVSHGCAAEVMTEAYAAFEALVANLLAPRVQAQSHAALSSAQIAPIMTAAVRGFKQTATDGDGLRRMIAELIAFVCAGLGDPAASGGVARAAAGPRAGRRRAR